MFLNFLSSHALKCGQAIQAKLDRLVIGFGLMSYNGRVNLASFVLLMLA